MQLNVLDDLTEAMKALDGKKSCRADGPRVSGCSTRCSEE